jgi:hypothetical protein
VAAKPNAAVKPPLPQPGSNPQHLLGESKWVEHWQATVESKFHGGSPAKNQEIYRQELTKLPQEARAEFARTTYESTRSAFLRLEKKNPTFAYTPEQAARLSKPTPNMPEAGLNLHHFPDLAKYPELAIDPSSLLITKGGERGAVQKGSLHYEVQFGSGARRLEAFMEVQKSKNLAAAPALAEPPATMPNPATQAAKAEGAASRPTVLGAEETLHQRLGAGAGNLVLEVLQFASLANTLVAQTFIFDIGSQPIGLISRKDETKMYLAGYEFQENDFAPLGGVWQKRPQEGLVDEIFGSLGPTYIIPGYTADSQGPGLSMKFEQRMRAIDQTLK